LTAGDGLSAAAIGAGVVGDRFDHGRAVCRPDRSEPAENVAQPDPM